RFQAIQFDVMLNSTVAGGDRRRGGVADYLQAALKDGKTWDRIFRELMLPDDADPKQKGAGEYLRTRLTDLDRVTNDVSVAFFGVNVSCAQCHDHPLVADWKQDHYYGMQSFFNRTSAKGNRNMPAGVDEKTTGEVMFQTTKGERKTAKMMFLSSQVIDEDKAKKA